MNGQGFQHAESGFGGLSQNKDDGNSDKLPKEMTETRLQRSLRFIANEATFFRIHLAAFTFIPLVFAGIFYASNGEYHVNFLDSMFLCYSAMTVTGLSTVDLSTTTKGQQFILYFLMAIGDITIVSWMMVLIRKRFFRTHCEYIEAKRKKPRSRKSLMDTISSPIATFKQREPTPRQPTQKSSDTPQVHLEGPTPGVTRTNTYAAFTQERSSSEETRVFEDVQTFTSSPRSGIAELPTLQDLPTEDMPPARPQSIKLDMNSVVQPNKATSGGTPMFSPQSILSTRSLNMASRPPQAVEFAQSTTVYPRRNSIMGMRERRGVPYPKRVPTLISDRPLGPPSVPFSPTSVFTAGTQTTQHSSKYTGMGGFPGPTQLLQSVVSIIAPNTYQSATRFGRKLTMTPSVQMIQGADIPWLPEDEELIVGRNSDFRTETLTDDQLEQVGGAEYRALRLLSYLVPAYFVLSQLVSIILFLPWLASTKEYDPVFEAQPRLVGKVWFSFFQVMGAYTGGGLSLVDMGMIPFQNAYLMIFALCWSILAGNHAMPIFLRCIIWTISKVLPDNSESQAALSFLLQHPRRCFMFLFPSHTTWFLVICLIGFSTVEWVCFVTLNIGLPAYESLSAGEKAVEGFFQGLAARASGFSIAPLASLAPALQFLYVVMMYIAVYPVALSIRTTNVYEERSLGVFEIAPQEEEPADGDINKLQSKKERIGKYVTWHLRKQTSIDIWWLVWGVFIIAIIERGNILDQDKKWFDLFRVLFELVSAFGGIGLTLGLPTDNYSFSGAFHPLSKLVVIVIMVRGRHRGLPVAVDRAVLLPNELVPNSNPYANNGPSNINFPPAQGPDFHEKPISPKVASPNLNLNRALQQTMSF